MYGDETSAMKLVR